MNLGLQYLKKSVAGLICAGIVLANPVRSSAEDVAEARQPASVGLVPGESEKPRTVFTEQQEKKIRNAFVDGAVRTSRMIKTHRDVERYLFDGMRSSDRIIFSNELAEFPEGKLPKFSNEGGDLVVNFVLDAQRVHLRIRWPNVHEALYYVNGVKFAYNPEKPLAPQIDLLNRQLAARNAVSIWEVIESSAEAAEDGAALLGSALDKVTNHAALASGVSAAAGSAAGTLSAAEAAAAATEKQGMRVKISAKLSKIKLTSFVTTLAMGSLIPQLYAQGGSGVIDLGVSGFCTTLNYMNHTATVWACPEWRKAQLEKLKKTNPSGALTKEAAVLARFEIEKPAISCPDNEDGKPRVLAGKIRSIGFDQDNKKSFTGEWYNIRFVWSPAGIPQSLIVTPLDIDPAKPLTDPSTAHRIVMSLSFDKDSFLTGATVPNINWTGANAGLLDSPTKTLSVDKVMNAEESAQYERAKDVLFTSLTEAKVCIVAKAQQAVSENTSPVKAPPAGTAPTGPTQSVAPVSTVQ